MARVTLNQALAKAMALDAQYGTEHRSDAVLCQMLDVVGRRARGELPQPGPRTAHVERQDQQHRQILKQRQLANGNRVAAARASAAQARRSEGREGVGGPSGGKASTRPLVKSGPAGQPHPDDAKVMQAAALGGTMTVEQAAAAIDAAVVQGRISGTEAVELLRRLKAKG